MRVLSGRPSVVLVAILLVSSTAAAHGPQCVNEYGDPQRLVIDGCGSFTPEAVATAVTSNADVVLAAHPAAPLAAYRDTLRDRIVLGYQRVGFPQVEVTARIDRESEKIDVTVKEGPRYTAGEIVVQGHKAVSAADLIKVLTSPRPPEDARRVRVDKPRGKTAFKWIDKEGNDAKMADPAWEPGKPAPFDRVAHQRFQRWTRRGLADQGYFSAFDVTLRPSSDGKTASLLIRITDEGPKAVLGEITITGNKQNTPAEILDYLSLKPGVPLESNRQTELEYRLWRSGRFIKSTVTVGAPPQGNHRRPLRIELVESPWAPRLGAPLSRAQIVLLKLRDQLANAQRWPGDLVATATKENAHSEVVISATHGAVGRIRWSSPPSEGYPDRFDASFVLTDRHYGLLCPVPLRAGLMAARAQRPQIRLIGSISMGLLEKTGDAQDTQFLTTSFGATTLEEGASPQPFAFDFDAAPSLFVALPNIDENAKCAMADGVLSLVSSKVHLRVEATTGRLLECAALDGGTGQPAATIQFRKGAFQSRLAQIQAASADCPNRYSAAAPWTSWIALLCDDGLLASLEKADPETLRWLRLARVMQQKGVLEGAGGVAEIARLFKPKDSDAEDKFTIPHDPAKWPDSDAGKMQHVILACGLPLVDKVFPRNSWPWTFTRELILVAAGQQQHTGAELQELCNSDRTGPVFYLAAASVLDIVNPQIAKLYAARGLDKLSAADFRKDCREILLRDCFAGRCARRIAQAARQLEPSEVDAILGKNPPNERSMLAEMIGTLRSRPERPIDDAILDALTAAWEAGQRARVKARLARIRDRKPLQMQGIMR